MRRLHGVAEDLFWWTCGWGVVCVAGAGLAWLTILVTGDPVLGLAWPVVLAIGGWTGRRRARPTPAPGHDPATASDA